MRSIEGARQPTTAAVPGDQGCLVNNHHNNVETFANIPVILLQGAEWFSGLGTERSKGTKSLLSVEK